MIKKISLLVMCVFSAICIYSQALNISLFNTINSKSEIKTETYFLFCSNKNAKIKALKFLRTNPSINAVIDMSNIADEDIEIVFSEVMDPISKAAIYSFDTNLGTMSGTIFYDYDDEFEGICNMRDFSFSIPTYALDNKSENDFSDNEKYLKAKAIDFMRTSPNVAIIFDMTEMADKDIPITIISDMIQPSKKIIIYSLYHELGRLSGVIMYNNKDSKDGTFTMENFSIPAYLME